VSVVEGDVAVDIADEFAHVAERVAADRLMGDEREPTLDLIKPARVGGGVMEMEARMRCRDEAQRLWQLEQERAEQERRRRREEERWKQVLGLVEYTRQAKMVREFPLDLERRMLIAAGDQGLSADVQNLVRIGSKARRRPRPAS